ncbi:hypothetical protein BDQ17DRAFT_1297221 [Cyathus striatus]|nr:hypothetical protein BDQ17DRAFT_1297221 [Cyathus striatus]
MKLGNLYNDWLHCIHATKICSPTVSMCLPTHSSSFYRDELQRAFSEQSFGIRSFHITSSNARQAVATVVLLEGQKLIVVLTNQGYSVDLEKSPGVPRSTGTDVVHEAVENLLQSISPLYIQRRQEALLSALGRLS